MKFAFPLGKQGKDIAIFAEDSCIRLEKSKLFLLWLLRQVGRMVCMDIE